MAAPKGNKYAEGNEGGRPKIGLDILWDGWYNDILELYSKGACDSDVKDLIKNKRKSFSNGLWERWIIDHKIFNDCISKGRELAKGKKLQLSESRKLKLLKRKQNRNQSKEYFNNKFAMSQRALLSHHIRKRGIVKSKRTFELFGYTPEDLINNIKLKLKDGMSYENYGLWHIDHIKPLSSFDLSKEEEIKKAWHFNNLQCLWAIDNLRKSNRYSETTVNYG